MKALSLAAVLLASPLLAGCLGLGDDAAPAATNATSNASDLPLALPDNRDGSFAAFQETNLTDDYGHHYHDYWQGRSRVVLFEGVGEMSPDPTADQVVAEFRPPTGAEHLVFEGTASIEVTVSEPKRRVCEPAFTLGGRFVCTDSSIGGGTLRPVPGGPGVPVPPTTLPGSVDDPVPSSGLRLEFLHAASNPDAWEDGGEIAWGTPSIVKVKDAKWTDMPHSTGSLWIFRVVSANKQDAGLKFTISATAIRATGEIPKWPGHPIFYTEGKHYRVVYDGRGSVEETNEGSLENKAEPAKLISAGTRTLLVFANITSVQGAVKPTHWWLYYHNASYTNWNATNPFDANYTADKTSVAWVLRVDANGMDSPYATLSRWEFMVRGAFTTPVISCLSGCVPYKVEYTLTIIATDLYPPCLQEADGKCVQYAYSQSRRA